MKKIIGYILIWSAFLGLFSFTTRVFADEFKLPYCQGSQTAIQTSIGCIQTEPSGVFTTIFNLSIGIGGGIAFLMLILGGLQIQTSAGNPERMNQGREIIEGAIIGLLLIVLSIFILRVVGINILGIPGFS